MLENLAEGVGFEPTESFDSLDFKSSAIGHSATPPKNRLYNKNGVQCRIRTGVGVSPTVLQTVTYPLGQLDMKKGSKLRSQASVLGDHSSEPQPVLIGWRLPRTVCVAGPHPKMVSRSTIGASPSCGRRARPELPRRTGRRDRPSFDLRGASRKIRTSDLTLIRGALLAN